MFGRLPELLRYGSAICVREKMQARKNNNDKRSVDISDMLSGDDTKPLEIGGMIGNSSPMRALFAALPKVAASTSPVIIHGASGTGKAMLARAIHSLSQRKRAPFVAVNCAAFPASLVQSELFGHAQSGAKDTHASKRGHFESADGGTLLIDEIAKLPQETQASLLRYLESGTIHCNGGSHSIDVDVRIITTTHVDLEAAVQAGTLCEDLYHRLNVLTVDMPPLRERSDDIQLLADHFYAQFTDDNTRYRLMGLSFDARLALYQWHWPGNVRELANRIQRAIIMCGNGPISRQDLGLERRRHSRRQLTLDEARNDAEKRAVLNALDQSVGNITISAESLGVCRMTLYRLMQKHGIVQAPGHPRPEPPAATLGE